MNTRFYIEKRKDGSGRLLLSQRPVFMSVSFLGKRLKLGTGIKADIQTWDPDLQRLRATHPEYKGHNSWLSALEECAERTWTSLQHSRLEPNEENFRHLFHQLKPNYSSGFFDVFFQFMEEGMTRWSQSTYRKVRSFYKLLREFEDQEAYGISFENLDARFLERFIAFCRMKLYRDSSTYKFISILVWFLNWATQQGFNVYRYYREFYKLMEPLQEPTGNLVSLKWEELLRIKDHMTQSRMMERARDLFCFMCFTGIRFSELQLLKKEDFRATEVIVRKSKNRLRRVPLNKFGRDIYLAYENKYYRNNTAFPSMSPVTLNKYLRKLGKEAGLKREVRLNGEEGSKPLHTCISAGMAVNTFMIHALEMQVPAEFIAEFTGVRDDSRVKRLKMDLAGTEMRKFDQK